LQFNKALSFKKWIELEIVIASARCTTLNSEVQKIPVWIAPSGINYKYGWCVHTQHGVMCKMPQRFFSKVFL
jgi:hypothetical protein